MAYRPQLSHLKLVYNNPYIIGNKFRQHTNQLRRRLFIKRYGEMTDVMSQDWDNLVILDACRYDTFKKRNTIDGKLTRSISNGSQSAEFISHNFCDRDLSDTIYVTSNPMAENIGRDTFYKIEKTYNSENAERFDYSGISPEYVMESAVEILDKHPNKRLIVHFMQPHSPYLGEYAAELREEINDDYGISFNRIQNSSTSRKNSETIPDLREAEKRGYITRDQLVEVYEENLDFVLKYAKNLLQEISGKSVVTSDHGELLGKTNSLIYNQLPFLYMRGHPAQTYLPELRFVPWLEVDGYRQRREVVKEDPIGTDKVESSTVEEHLKALGYA